MPKVTINLNDEDYHNFFLTYKCMYDTNVRYQNKNEECYTAPWVNLDSALEGAFKKKLISKDDITKPKDIELINKQNITLSEFEHIFTTYTNYTIQEILSSAYNLAPIPTFETDSAAMTFDIEGLVLIKEILIK